MCNGPPFVPPFTALVGLGAASVAAVNACSISRSSPESRGTLTGLTEARKFLNAEAPSAVDQAKVLCAVCSRAETLLSRILLSALLLPDGRGGYGLLEIVGFSQM